MADNWSLKDKGMKGYPDGKHTLFFGPEVIETLRKKLIEDEIADFWGEDWLSTCDKYPSMELEESQPLKNKIARINKRFGVE